MQVLGRELLLGDMLMPLAERKLTRHEWLKEVRFGRRRKGAHDGAFLDKGVQTLLRGYGLVLLTQAMGLESGKIIIYCNNNIYW